MGGFLRGGMATLLDVAAAVLDGLGFDQAYSDVTAQRAKNVVYTNSTGRPLFVCITGTASSVAGSIYVDGVCVGWLSTVAQQGNQFIVPPGSTYELSQAGGTVVYLWGELF